MIGCRVARTTVLPRRRPNCEDHAVLFTRRQNDGWTIVTRLVDGAGKLRGAQAASQPCSLSGDFGRDPADGQRSNSGVADAGVRTGPSSDKIDLGLARRWPVRQCPVL